MKEDASKRSRARIGISLLAVLVTLAAIALAAVIAIPAFFARQDVTLENVCRTIVKDIRAVQTRASFMGEEIVVEFHQDGYRVRDREGREVRRSGRDEPLSRSFSKDGVFEGVRLDSIRFGEDRAVVFDGHGRAHEAGEVTVEFGGERKVLLLEARSGEVFILAPQEADGLRSAAGVPEPPRRGAR